MTNVSGQQYAQDEQKGINKFRWTKQAPFYRIGIRHKKIDKNICSDLAYIIRTTTHRIYWKSFNSF